ncbi:MAG: hypothetical protein POELPBGB_01329 [Bacteroidia bacterium]|nr:hypothetical protein [Bacteroidia bacterium]
MKYFFTSIIFIFSLNVSAQKIKTKKNIIYADGTAFLEKSCKNEYHAPCVFSSPISGKRSFSTIAYPYTKRVRVYKNNLWIEENRTAHYFHVKFIDHNRELYTSQLFVQFLKVLFAAKVINEAGETDAKVLDDFIKIYGENKPIIVNTY